MALHENQLWDMNATLAGRPLSPVPARHRQKLEALKRDIAEWEYRVSLARPQGRQVLHLIEKLGGILPFCVAVGRHPNHVIRLWLGVTRAHKVNKDRWGTIPSNAALVRLVTAARSYGVFLTPEDLYPDMISGGTLKNAFSHNDLASWFKAIEPDITLQKLETRIADLLEA